MQKLAAVGLIVGLATASCSGGHGSSAALPPVQIGNAGPSGSGAAATNAARTTRSAPPGWAATATLAFNPANASDTGVLPSSQTLTVRLGLGLHNTQQLQSLIASGQTVSPEAFVATYGPTQAEVQSVTSYLQQQGLSNITVEPNNLLVSASGSAAQISTAFNTTLHAFSVNGVTAYANTAPAYVPSAIGNTVVAVLGLNNVQTFKTPKRSPQPVVNATPTPAPLPTAQPESACNVNNVVIVGLPSPQPEPTQVSGTAGCLRTYTPSDFWRAYDALTVPAASNVAVAVMAEGNVSSSIADLRVNEKGDSLTQVPVVVKQVGLASTDTAGADEWTLDMIAASGMAQNVSTIYLYDTTSLTDSDIALEYNHWVTDHLAKIGNSSFGGCEYGPYVDGSMLVDDEILAQGAAQGQTMFASTGDTGSFCSVGTPNGVPAGVPLVEYPAASPYVVGVGGTTLSSAPDGSYWGEAAWDAGGGGISQFEYSPYWQNGVQPGNNASVPATFRGLPDIAMDGDLTTGMVVYIGSLGGWTVIGGTSLSSPLAAGAWARVLQQHPNAGYAAPALYRAYKSAVAGGTTNLVPATRPVGPFHDILSGSNGAYTALPGYDYTTGIGSLDVKVLTTSIGP